MGILDQHDADLAAVFYDTAAGFAETATASGGGGVVGVFESGFYAAPGGEITIGQASPSLRVLDSVAAGLSVGNILSVRSVTYKITEKRPTGDGETVLNLSRSGYV